MLAGEERLRPLPGTPYPAVIEDSRQISPQALVSWKGNLYSVPPGRPREQAIVRHQLGADTVDILTPAGVTLARHYREPDHAGGSRALISTSPRWKPARKPCPARRRAVSPQGPPGLRRPAALAEAARITGSPAACATVTDFAVYAAAAGRCAPSRAQPAASPASPVPEDHPPRENPTSSMA